MVRKLVILLPVDATWANPDPNVTTARGIEVAEHWDGGPAAILGWSDGGAAALTLAAEGGDLIDRLVLVAVPAPIDGPPPVDLAIVRAKALLLFGSEDPRTGSRHGRWWQTHLSNARLEMVPGGGHDLVAAMWARIASFVAARRG